MGKGKARKKVPAQEPYLLRILMDTLPDSIYFKDGRNRFTRINQALARKLGLSHPSDAIGKTDFDFFADVHAQHALEIEQEILRTGQPVVDLEEKEIWPDGRESWVMTTKMPLRDSSEAIIGTFGISRDVTDHKRGEVMLRDSEALYHSLVENLPQNIFRKDLEGRLTYVNRRYIATLGIPLDKLLGKTDDDLFPPELARKYKADDQRVIKTGETFADTEAHQPPGQPMKHVRVVKTPVLDARGYVIGTQGMFWDVTEQVAAQEALKKSEERYALAIAGANDGIWDWDQAKNEIHYSARWKEQLGFKDAEIGTEPDEWMRRVHPDDIHDLKVELNNLLSGRSGHFENEHRMRHRGRGYRWMLSRGVAVRDGHGKVTRMAGSQTDITDRKRAEEELSHQAFYDSLTDLPNRVLFLDRLNQVIRRSKRKAGQQFAVLFLDLDRFKDVNDGLGHNNGDLLLTSIARKLEACVRPGDTVARLGGDEFTILLDDLRHPDDAIQVAERIQRDLSKPVNLNGHDVFASASMGIAPGGIYDKPDHMLRDADAAMYRAKERGRNCYELFDPNMHLNAVARLHLETDLRRALERGEFHAYYQPIVSLKTDSLVGFEALVRWTHPTRGLVSPGDFLPLAEDTGLILPIDMWVLREACTQIKAWQDKYPSCPPLTINVNLSSKHFSQAGLVERISDVLRDTGLDGPSLRLEITESVIMDDSPAIRKVLQEIKELKAQIYLDDFGTGYSSLGYLHRFPIDSLKIHQSFVGQMGQESDKGELVKTITTLAANLKMGVVAEGVETEEQLARLRTLQCDRVQGYFFGKPLEKKAAEELIQKRPRWTQGRVRTA